MGAACAPTPEKSGRGTPAGDVQFRGICFLTGLLTVLYTEPYPSEHTFIGSNTPAAVRLANAPILSRPSVTFCCIAPSIAINIVT